MTVATLNVVASLTLKTEGDEEVSHADNWEKNLPGRGNRDFKGCAVELESGDKDNLI